MKPQFLVLVPAFSFGPTRRKQSVWRCTNWLPTPSNTEHWRFEKVRFISPGRLWKPKDTQVFECLEGDQPVGHHQGPPCRYGHKLLVNMVEYALGATVSLNFPPTGCNWECIAPLENVCITT